MAAKARTAKASRKAWSYSAGERGTNRVRVYERAGLGIWIDYRDELGVRLRAPLRITDRDEAKAKADEIALKFRREAKRRPTELTLSALIDTYRREVTPGKTLGVQKHDARAFELFLRQFGANRRPATLNRRDWDAFIAARRSGQLRPPGTKRRGVRNRIIEQDLSLLRALLNWAVMAGDGAAATSSSETRSKVCRCRRRRVPPGRC